MGFTVVLAIVPSHFSFHFSFEVPSCFPLSLPIVLVKFSHVTPTKYSILYCHFPASTAWMNGLEVCSIEANTAKASLILSVGISTRYTYATYKKTPETTKEAEAWEAAKKACGGLHFLAIQEDLESDDCVGFWLLLDLSLIHI